MKKARGDNVKREMVFDMTILKCALHQENAVIDADHFLKWDLSKFVPGCGQAVLRPLKYIRN